MATSTSASATNTATSQAPNDSNTGIHQNEGPNSVSGLLSTLIPTLLLFIVLITAFIFLRIRVKRIYQPRTYLGALSDHQKTPHNKDLPLSWVKEFFHISDEFVLNHHSLDAYLFVRFWRLVVLICAIGWPLTWIILMPVYGTSHEGAQQFNKIAFGNIDASQDARRLYATNFVAWIFLGIIMVLVGRESLFYVRLRQAFLLLPGIASRLASRTVLFTNVPGVYLDEDKLRRKFPSVNHIWICTDTSHLERLINIRDGLAQKMEKAEIKISKKAHERRRKALKNGDADFDKEDTMKWAKNSDRPRQWQDMPILGDKIDTIEYCREQLPSAIGRVQAQQEVHTSGQALLNSAVFIEFETVQAAEAAFRRVQPLPSGMTPRTLGSRPQEVVWPNVNMGNTARGARNFVSVIVILIMILFWGVITSFIGSVSNVESLTQSIPFLDFINDIPSKLQGIVSGLLPAALLSLALILVPIIMRSLFRWSGGTSTSEIELKVQTWHFVFQVIQVFLVTSISSGIAASISAVIDDPSNAAKLLAANLPSASNFYINYFVFYGLVIGGKQILNLVTLGMYIIWGKLVDSTPRAMFKRYVDLDRIKWGTEYPKYTNLAVIAITYSCIAPLILAFATIGFAIFFFVFRYAVVYSVDTLSINTQGRAYAKALQQLTVGVYLAELCLIGLFAMTTASSGAASGPMVLMILFLVVTAIFHFVLNRAIAALELNLSHTQQPSRPTSEIPVSPRTVAGDGSSIMSTVTNNDKVNLIKTGAAPLAKLQGKAAGLLMAILRPPALPNFDPYLQTPLPRYSPEQLMGAYLNPSITSEMPLVWIVRDAAGVSEREINESAGVVGMTDEGAWWDEKTGKLRTIWMGEESRGETDMARQAPIFVETANY